jgi:multicomponent Na+:H+ antiporter subunit A
LPAGAFAALIAHVFMSGDAILSESSPWVERLGLTLAFRIDGLSMLFLLVITGIASLIFIYAGGYLKGHPQLGRFYAYLLLFTAAMIGLVAADNLLLVFIFWELTSISSYFLIGFKHSESTARASALQALLVTGFGGLAFLAGLILLGVAAGDLSLAAINQNAATVKANSLYPAAFALVCLGAFTKSAQWPFHFWLPGAMAAPTPVSAFLHSATMVNAGVYLLARLAPALGGTDAWHYTLTTVGTVTMLVGAVLAWPQTDLKRLLAFSTVSALGTMVLLLGLDTVLSVKAAMVFFFVHALYKGALFMVAGTVDHGSGTRDVRELGGLIRTMPITAVAAGVAAFSMAGLPPLLGFIAKELIYEAKTQTPLIGHLVTTAGFIGSALMVAVAFIVGVRPFQGVQKNANIHAHEGPFSLWLGPLVLAAASLAFGLLPGLLDKPVLSSAVSAVRAEETVVTLKLWHGFNLVLLLSMATLAMGLFAFFIRHQARTWKEQLRGLGGLGPEGLYERIVGGLVPFADALTRTIQHGRLRLYVATLIAFTAGHRVGSCRNRFTQS